MGVEVKRRGKQIGIRIREDLHDQVEQLRWAEKLSFTKALESVVERYFTEHPAPEVKVVPARQRDDAA
jgi:hypothetical protein|tara:strand:- start:3861 stop:4064 length:204 start_codon:yes stop_codon:yes gene_type:complete